MIVTNLIPLFRMAGLGPLGLPTDPTSCGVTSSAVVSGESRAGSASAYVAADAGFPVGIAGRRRPSLIACANSKIGRRDAPSAAAAEGDSGRIDRPPTAPRPDAGQPMSGTIDEISLADLLQLLADCQESGVLEIRSIHGNGRIYLGEGRVHFCEIEESPNVSPRKAAYRMLRWTEGAFEFLTPEDGKEVRGIPEDRWMSDSTTSILRDGLREMDEINRLSLKTLKPWSAMTADLQAGRLRDLKPEELDVLQIVLEHGGLLDSLLDRFPGSDLQALTALVSLVGKGFVIFR